MKRQTGFLLPCWAVLIVVVFCWPSILFADEAAPTFVAQMGDNKVYLYPAPCPLGGWFAEWRKAQWLYQGKFYESCWRLQRTEQGVFVHTVDANGDVGSLPASIFKKAQQI